MTTETNGASAEITKLAREAFIWLGSTTIIWQIVAWSFTIFTAHLLTPSDYGLLALADTINPYLAILASLNITTWIIQRSVFNEEDAQGTFILSLMSGLLMGAIAYILAPIIADFYHTQDLTLPLRFLSITFIIRGVSFIPDAIIRRSLYFKTIGLMNIFVVITRGLIQVLLAWNGMGYWALVIGILYKDLAECIWLIAAVGLPRKISLRLDLIIEALKFGLPATLGTFCWIVYSTSDTIFVGRLLGSEILGFYAMALYLVDMPLSKLNTVIRPVLYPYFSRMKDLPGQFNPAFLKSIRVILAITFPSIVGLAAIAPNIVHLALGSNWDGTGEIVRYLALIGLVKAFNDNIHVAFTVLGRTDLIFKFNALGMILLPVSFLILGSYLKLSGIFIGWAIILPILCILNLNALNKLSGITPTEYMKNAAGSFICSLIMGVCVTGLGLIFQIAIPQFEILIIQVLFGIIIYLTSYRIFFSGELSELISLVKPKFSSC